MRRKRVLVIGWRGGVGTALLSLLGSHPTGREISKRIEALFLVDRASGGPCRLPDASVLADADCNEPETLARLLRDFAIDTVIEVADVDTPATSAICERHGADYVSASIQCHGKLTIPGASDLLGARPAVRTSQLLGAGMNPGIVNVLARVAVEDLARRHRVDVRQLELAGVHVTELDTTTSSGVEPDVFAMSWSPEHALSEILEPAAMYVAQTCATALPHRPHDRLYAARCGDEDIAAMIVPHEELVSIGARFPEVESAFFYAVPAAYATLRRAPDRPVHEWATRKLYPPEARCLSGKDRVGALIVSKRYGELWTGFEHDAGVCARGGSYNATTLQAAAGVLAGWAMVGTRRGVHVTDDLDHRAYLDLVEAILGARRIVHAPDAPPRSVASRRCEAGGVRERDRATIASVAQREARARRHR